MIDLQTFIIWCIASFILGCAFCQAIESITANSAKTLLDEADEYFDATVRRALRIVEIAEEEKEA